MPAANDDLSRDIAQRTEGLIALRRYFHERPELSFQEHETAAEIARRLRAMGLEPREGVGRTGVTALLEGQAKSDQPRRTLLVRVDIDALPVQEESQHPWKSQRPGVMHACGHDGHTTMLLGAARYLATTRQFAGTVYCIFQPGEEGLGGAKAMMDDGLFARFPADWIFSMHNWPQLPAGRIGLAPGPMMAAADRITIKVTGEGGHGAHPYLTVDPVLVSAHIITAVQSIVARNVNPLDEAVVSICALQGGDLAAMSVIPRHVTLVGTVRTFRAEVQALVEKRLNHIVQSVAQAFGATAELEYERIYPATINTPQAAHYAAEVAAELVGDGSVVRNLPPSMGAEDFAFMLQAKPGAYLRLGQGSEGGCFLHTPRYDFNDAVLPLGAALYARLAERVLSQPTGVMML